MTNPQDNLVTRLRGWAALLRARSAPGAGLATEAADTIERLTAERDEYEVAFTIWRERWSQTETELSTRILDGAAVQRDRIAALEAELAIERLRLIALEVKVECLTAERALADQLAEALADPSFTPQRYVIRQNALDAYEAARKETP